MKFTGQLKIPDLDAPGVPAAVHIEDNQTEIMVQGESLGRWSLVDVRAERLVSSAFSLKLDGEEVTFIADEPTDFAYRGVDHMANVWARYKSMTLPRRKVASARSRKGTKASRIGDLRTAIEETLVGETISLPTQGRVPGETAVAPPAKETSAPATRRSRPVWETDPAGIGLPDSAPPDSSSPEIDQPDPQPLPPEETESSQLEPMLPEPLTPEPVSGRHEAAESPPAIPLDPDHLLRPDEKEVRGIPSSPSGEEVRPAAATESAEPESVYKDTVPWAKAALSVEPESVEPDSTEPDSAESALESPAAATEFMPPVAPAGQSPSEHGAATAESASPTMPDPVPASAVPWIDPSATEEPVGNDAAVQDPVEVEIPIPPGRQAEDREWGPPAEPKYVVDLGAFEDRRIAPAEERQNDEPEPALAAAKEKAGLMGAVRSAFVRNREEHEHEYVQAPGGLGIVRQICAECGHISIGVAE